jgi:hypothetical protein
MAANQGGTTRREGGNDLQHDDGGQGHTQQRSQEEIDKELDKSLEDSFPSSDPPATRFVGQSAVHLSSSNCTFLGFAFGTVCSRMGWSRQECTASWRTTDVSLACFSLYRSASRY